MKSTLIFLGLSAVAFAHTGIKSRLAQQAAPLSQCTCALPANATTVGLPPLRQGTYNGFNQAGQVTTGSQISTIPDTEVLEQGASECCSCNTGAHSAAASGSKTGNSSSQSAGEANKQSSNAVSNVANGGNGAPNGGCVSVCANNGTIAL